mmetsp:Transcript_29954/g.65336  ORF Transcript_29954/g.65336 Transcript_29954/m.65336 type:complete len:154 (+) Transcript_29954:1152-1613(+)
MRNSQGLLPNTVGSFTDMVGDLKCLRRKPQELRPAVILRCLRDTLTEPGHPTAHPGAVESKLCLPRNGLSRNLRDQGNKGLLVHLWNALRLSPTPRSGNGWALVFLAVAATFGLSVSCTAISQSWLIRFLRRSICAISSHGSIQPGIGMCVKL